MILKKGINAKHRKTGNDYVIVGLTKNCTNKNDGEILVLYESQTTFKDVHFSREVNEFIEKFEISELQIMTNILSNFKAQLREYTKPE